MELHVFPGAHKTATTLLQRTLELNRSALEAEGYAIARRRPFYRTGLLGLLRKPGGVAEADRGQLEAAFAEAFGLDPSGRHLIISIENLFGEVRPGPYRRRATAVIENLLRAFPDRDLRVHFYARRQDDFLESAYLQSHHEGQNVELQSFIAGYESAPVDWLDVLERCGRLLSRSAISLTPFERIREGVESYVLEFFAKFCALDPAVIRANVEGRLSDTNLSLSGHGLTIARAAFPSMPERAERKRLAQYLQREFGVDRLPRYRLPDDLRLSIARWHREPNERLVRSGWLDEKASADYLFTDLLGEA